MYCENCGAQIEDGAAFCPQCGAAQNGGPQPAAQEPAKGILPVGKKGLAAAAAAGIAVIAVVAAVLLSGRGKEGDADTGDQGAGSGIAAEDTANETPLCHIDDVASVDLSVQGHTPAAKQPGMKWDNSLFYWLEDVDTTSPDDGYIANCRLTKTLLRDTQSGNLIQYEIYSDPADGTVYKIVSIEERESGLKLTDYYYQNGLPNFVFTRKDSVYTPTYATIEKVGERYYFNNDVMVRWRMIRNPGEIGEYVLAPEDVWYSQADYYAEGDDVKAIYDDTELRMLNAAYNTYDAVTGGKNTGLVQGLLRDTAGNGAAGKKISLRRASDDALLYQAVTGENGEYAFFVYLDDTDCYLRVEADDTYKETTVQGIRLSPSSVIYTYGLTMHRNDGDEYPVAFRLYSCMDVVSGENGTATGEALQTASATVREGAGNYNGEAFLTAEIENGELKASLPSGVYTVQFHTDGYLDCYTEVEVMEEALSTDIYVMPGLAESQTGVILTWEGEDVDLDLTLFTPEQAGNGDMARIGGNTAADGKGNILVADNTGRCEAMFINTGLQGSYKLYVNNYTDSAAGSYASDGLNRVNVHVYIYNSDGFVAEYTLPVGQNGVVWEVAEINGRNVTPSQRVYTEISGKSWWVTDKHEADLVAAMRQILESGLHDLEKQYGYADMTPASMRFAYSYYLNGELSDSMDTWTMLSGIAKANILDMDGDGKEELLIILLEGSNIYLSVYEADIISDALVKQAEVVLERSSDLCDYEDVCTLVDGNGIKYLLFMQEYGSVLGDGYYGQTRLYQYDGINLYTPLRIVQEGECSAGEVDFAERYDANGTRLWQEVVYDEEARYGTYKDAAYCLRRVKELFGTYGIAIGDNVYNDFLAPEQKREELMKLRMRGDHNWKDDVCYFEFNN